MFSNKQTHRKGNQICGPQRLGWREGELDEGGQKITNFLMYVSQIIMLYTLNLYSSVCQLYLNKTGFKKEQMFSPLSRIVSSTCYIFPHSLSFYNTKIHGTPSLLSAPPPNSYLYDERICQALLGLPVGSTSTCMSALAHRPPAACQGPGFFKVPLTLHGHRTELTMSGLTHPRRRSR